MQTVAVTATLAPRRSDAILATVLIAVSQVEVWGYHVAGGGPAAGATLGLAAAAMVLRSWNPVLTTVLVALGLTLCARYAGEPFSATSVLTFTIAFFSVGAMSRRRVSVSVLLLASALGVLTVQPLTLNNYLAITLSSVAVPWLLGMLWLRHSTFRGEERRRQEAAQDAVAAERLRLAQDLHDVVSHNVGMIAVQAGAADVLLDTDPVRSRESLRAIELGARETLLELRRMLGLLRDDDPDPVPTRATLAGLPSLIEPLTHAGVAVALTESGTPVPLSAPVETVAYRLVQEALTNVLSHAGPCRVQVTLHYTPHALGVEVADDGTARGGTSRGGYGLGGIRERVAALGGTVTAGPRTEGGGFAVSALLPLGVR